MFFKIVCLKNIAIFTGKDLCWSLFSIKTITLNVLNFVGAWFCDFGIFPLNCKLKYQGEMLQVYSREVKYARNLISRGSKTTFYQKKFIYHITFLKDNLFYSLITTLLSLFCCPLISLLLFLARWNNVLMSSPCRDFGWALASLPFLEGPGCSEFLRLAQLDPSFGIRKEPIISSFVGSRYKSLTISKYCCSNTWLLEE